MAHPVADKAERGLHVGIPSHAIGIRGRLYRVSALRSTHPGGTFWIDVCGGKDATALFESSHVNVVAAERMLGGLETIGTYEAVEAWDYTTLRRLQRRVLALFPTRASRRAGHDRYAAWACVAAVLHCAVCLQRHVGAWWLCACVASAATNTVVGGFAHDRLHRLDVGAIGLDWNGLSSYEWMLEHVASHHPRPNTVHDHDAISMCPFVDWNRRRWTNLCVYPLFFVGEIVVALQGNVGHRCRWNAKTDLRWMRLAPWLFVARAASHLTCQGVVLGAATLVVTLGLASAYFSYLAHLNHAPHAPPTSDFAVHQLGSTMDLTPLSFGNDLLLGLDRQSMHHLFPTVRHSLLNVRVRDVVRTECPDVDVEPKSVCDLDRRMRRRLLP